MDEFARLATAYALVALVALGVLDILGFVYDALRGRPVGRVRSLAVMACGGFFLAVASQVWVMVAQKVGGSPFIAWLVPWTAGGLFMLVVVLWVQAKKK